ncbi:site-specific integrase [Lactiplantibacillus pentosus]|nr:site-specific integrase [Lactiplantibacillus pentosus]
MDYLLKTRNKNFTSKYMIITALMTGMRPGEIQGLRWQDINPLFNTIQVTQSWNEANQAFQDLKNESSHRTVRIDKWLIGILSEIPKRGSQDLVFVNQYGTIPTSSAINKTLHESLHNNIVLKGFHFHSCRHTHVAYLLARGIDLYAISKRLGHSNIIITANVYSYLIDEYKAKTDDQIVKSLEPV